MSKKNKLLASLFKVPPPKGFRWEDLVTLMRQAGFEATCEGGSHYTFEHSTGFRFVMSKTHPEGILKQYQVQAAKRALETVGFLEDRENV